MSCSFERLIRLDVKGDDNNITDEEWEELGRRDVAKNTYMFVFEKAH